MARIIQSIKSLKAENAALRAELGELKKDYDRAKEYTDTVEHLQKENSRLRDKVKALELCTKTIPQDLELLNKSPKLFYLTLLCKVRNVSHVFVDEEGFQRMLAILDRIGEVVLHWDDDASGKEADQ